MSTLSPAPFPDGGLRPLSAREQLQRLKALACTMPASNRPDCSGQIYVGLFFDGTGNNMEEDYRKPPPDLRKHSNIVKLFLTCRSRPNDGFFRVYMPGVGTPFSEIGDSGSYSLYNRGSAHGDKGEHRIIWAFTQLLNAPHSYVTGAPLIPDPQAKTIVNNVAGISSPAVVRRMVLNTWQDKLRAALDGRRPQVAQINLSVFGFSRGAAQARAFVNWLFEVCEQRDGGWAFAGIPIRCGFLGIFDTVASVGLANLDDTGTLAGHQSWADNSLQIHPAVEHCQHFVAGHEVRACFPLDSVRVGRSYPANATEVMYPGAHSDVGGGYAPGALGVSPSFSMIPGARMYHEACKAGVHLEPWARLDKHLRDDLTPPQATIRDFNAYVNDSSLGAAPVEELHRRHMSLYFSYRFKRRHHFQNTAPYLTASPQDRPLLGKTQSGLIQRLRSLGHGDPMSQGFDPFQAASLYQGMHKASGLTLSGKDRQLLEVARRMEVKRVTPAVEAFFDGYVHDSMAGFMQMGVNEYNLNGMGLSKFRTVFKGND